MPKICLNLTDEAPANDDTQTIWRNTKRSPRYATKINFSADEDICLVVFCCLLFVVLVGWLFVLVG